MNQVLTSCNTLLQQNEGFDGINDILLEVQSSCSEELNLVGEGTGYTCGPNKLPLDSNTPPEILAEIVTDPVEDVTGTFRRACQDGSISGAQCTGNKGIEGLGAGAQQSFFQGSEASDPKWCCNEYTPEDGDYPVYEWVQCTPPQEEVKMCGGANESLQWHLIRTTEGAQSQYFSLTGDDGYLGVKWPERTLNSADYTSTQIDPSVPNADSWSWTGICNNNQYNHAACAVQSRTVGAPDPDPEKWGDGYYWQSLDGGLWDTPKYCCPNVGEEWTLCEPGGHH